AITTQPVSTTIDNGQSDTLSVTPAYGSTPYLYQWYIGNSGDFSHPISGANNSYYTATPSSTTSYWVAVDDQAGAEVDSNPATVTVNPALAITTQPASSTINGGQSATLSVTAGSGTAPYSYQWYTGVSGGTS